MTDSVDSPKTKMLTMMKTVFYKNITDQGGAMQESIDNQKIDTVLVHSHTRKNGRCWGSMTHKQLLTSLEKNNGLFEVLHHFPHKVYFDIDAYGIESFADYKDSVINTILTFFPNADSAMSGNHTQGGKSSLHVVLNNYLIHNAGDRNFMKVLTAHIDEHICKGFDSKVYTKNRFMKCVNQSKVDGLTQEIILNPDFKKHVISTFFNHEILPMLDNTFNICEIVAIEQSKKSFDFSTLPKIVLSCDNNFEFDELTPKMVLKMLPIEKKYDFKHSYLHLVARFCKTHEFTFSRFCKWYSCNGVNSMSADHIEKWEMQFNNLHKFPPVSIHKMKSVLCYFYPHLKKDMFYRRFSQSFEYDSNLVQKIEAIEQTHFNTSHKYALFSTGMGSGKTAQTIDYCKHLNEFLFIAPNQALASNIKNRFESQNIDVTHYLQMSAKSKKEGELNNVDKLITVLNSLHYLNARSFVHRVVIIDEIETLLDKFQGDFLEQGQKQLKNKIWTTFIRNIRQANKVIFLDAFITNKTLNFINALQGSLDGVVIFKRMYEPQMRTIKYMPQFANTLDDAITKIKNGSKVFIYYPYKNDTGDVFSMEKVYLSIIERTGKKGYFYNADVDDTTKSHLKDVNHSWNGANFIITNNIMTCGVNYDIEDFDYKYLFVASFCSPRDIIQVSYRARFLSSGVINVCYMKHMHTTNTWVDDCYKMKCSIYNQLYNDILTEKKAPLKRAFACFCVKANYRQTSDSATIDGSIEKEISTLLEKQECGFTYDNIPDIDADEVAIFEQLCFEQQATMLQKIQLQKYFFKSQFMPEAYNASHPDMGNILAFAWNASYQILIKTINSQIINNKKHDSNIFVRISEENNFVCLFPADANFKKMKISKKLKEDIFKNFRFRSLTPESNTTCIMTNIYNTYFGKAIIKKEFDANKHVSYTISQDFNDLYEFCQQYLIKHDSVNIQNRCILDL